MVTIKLSKFIFIFAILIIFFVLIFPQKEILAKISDFELSQIKTELNLADFSEFRWISDSRLKEVLNQEIDHKKASDLTYGIYILSILNEIKFINWIYTGQYIIDFNEFIRQVVEPKTRLSPIIGELGIEAVSDIAGKYSGITYKSFFTTIKVLEIWNIVGNITQKKEYNGLRGYLIDRGNGLHHEGAWEMAKKYMGWIPNPEDIKLFHPWHPARKIDEKVNQLEPQLKSLWNKWGQYLEQQGINKEFERQTHKELRDMLLIVLKAPTSPSILERAMDWSVRTSQNIWREIQDIGQRGWDTIQRINLFGANIVTSPLAVPEPELPEIQSLKPQLTVEPELELTPVPAPVLAPKPQLAPIPVPTLTPGTEIALIELQERLNKLAEEINLLRKEIDKLVAQRVQEESGDTAKHVVTPPSVIVSSAAPVPPIFIPPLAVAPLPPVIIEPEGPADQPVNPNPEQESKLLASEPLILELTPVPVPTTPPQILISEIQIEGEEKSHDFIELYNPTDKDIYLNNYEGGHFKLVKRTKSGGNNISIKSWSRESETKIPSRGYYLWARSEDEKYPSSINADTWTKEGIAANNGIALLWQRDRNEEDLIVDALGWGDFKNILFENFPFPENPEKNKSLGRRWSATTESYIDTNDNSQDFEIQIPTPGQKNTEYTDNAPEKEWSQVFTKDSRSAKARSVQQTKDGGFIIVGETTLIGGGHRRIWLVKTNKQGNKEWSRVFHYIKDYQNENEKTVYYRTESAAYSVQQTTDGGFIIAGYRINHHFEAKSVFLLIKTDYQGNKQWDTTFNFIGAHEKAFLVQQIKDKDYFILAGWGLIMSESFSMLSKINSKGEKEWVRIFNEQNRNKIYSVQQIEDKETKDKGFILSGWIWQNNQKDFWLVKTDVDGIKKWSRAFSNRDDSNDWAYSVQQTKDGGFIIAGVTDAPAAEKSDFWLVKTDSNGKEEWNRIFGGPGNDKARSVQQTKDGGFIITGWKDVGIDKGNRDVWLIKTNPEGEKEWSHVFGEQGADEAYSVQQTIDGGFIIAGKTSLEESLRYNFWLIKVAADFEQDLTPLE